MEKGLILKWLNGSGAGSGDGSGAGSGDGSGAGSGYGSGAGWGDGWGYGWGYGSGDGLGYGSGYGSGAGSGYDEKLIKLKGYDIFYIDEVPTVIINIKNNYAKGFMVGSNYQLTPCYVAKDEYTNLFAHGKTLKDAVSSLQEKVYRDMPEEERIKAFTDNFKPNKAYKGTEYFKWHNILTGSCLMGREQFIKDNDLNLNANYTVNEFISIVEYAYGCEIIKKLKKIYGSK